MRHVLIANGIVGDCQRGYLGCQRCQYYASRRTGERVLDGFTLVRGALHFANEPGVQRGARHYHRGYHYVRECIILGEINLHKVHTDDNRADPFMKALSKGKLTQHARRMGLRLASSFM
ncbi:hypothetical protein Tco_0615062 [Tanacetum coccineum]